MTISTKDYAYLSTHVYGDMPNDPLVAGAESEKGLRLI